MTIEVFIDTDNAAFDGDARGPEIARILRDLANRWDGPIKLNEFGRTLYDANGNKCGMARVMSHPLAKYA